MLWDTFLFHDELDMLECRLIELDDVVDRFVLVEAEVTHTGKPKPSYYLEHKERFAPWADRISHVWGIDLPDDSDAWAREHAQREWIGRGLKGASPSDTILLSDVDEIPYPHVLRNLSVDRFIRFEHRLYCFAVDWLHPQTWIGTVAAPRYAIDSFVMMRNYRLDQYDFPTVSEGGWHFTWLGGTEANRRKIFSFSHVEQREEVLAGLDDDNRFLRDGIYIGGIRLRPVDVDATWPAYIANRRCPQSWFRPRTRSNTLEAAQA